MLSFSFIITLWRMNRFCYVMNEVEINIFYLFIYLKKQKLCAVVFSTVTSLKNKIHPLFYFCTRKLPPVLLKFITRSSFRKGWPNEVFQRYNYVRADFWNSGKLWTIYAWKSYEYKTSFWWALERPNRF